jgi:predicted Zn finger-like uncharacterized protein
MKFICTKCNAKYNIEDSKIPKGGAKVRCKKCQNPITISKTETTLNLNAHADSIAQVNQEIINKTKETASALSEKAVHFGKKAKEKAGNFRDFANEKASSYREKSYNSDKINTKLNKFLFFSFKIGKYISAFCIVAFFMVFLGSLIFYFVSFGDSFEHPKFETFVSYIEATDSNKKPDFSQIDKRKEVEDKYGGRIKKIVRYGFSEESYDIFLNRLVNYPAEYRKAYVNGLDDFLSDGLHYKEKRKNNNIDIVKLSIAYKEAFDEEIRNAKISKSMNSTKKFIVLGVIVVSMLLYILFLVIPILIKLEENTRLKQSVTSPEFEIANKDGNLETMVNKQSPRQENPIPQ